MNVRDDIVRRRIERIAAEGHEFGKAVPPVRTAPLLPFVTDPLLICEIKRRSPSRGAIASGLDPVVQAGIYTGNGVRSVSVLTEEDWFGGSLDDLMAVKAGVPGLAVLRKDFLVDEEDVRVSHRAGADAILLIASMLEAETLGRLHALACSLGMAVLVEVHSLEEIRKVAPFRPALMGINSRNLETFAMDLLLPARLRGFIDWECRVVFESGLFGEEDSRYAVSQGFAGLLVGEAVVKDPGRIPLLLKGFSKGAGAWGGQALAARNDGGFWARIAALLQARLEQAGAAEAVGFTKAAGAATAAAAGSVPGKGRRPLVKICGICSREDALEALKHGADILGFIFASSPRRCPDSLPQALADLDCIKVAVVCNEVPPVVQDFLDRGLIHGVQFSGDESPAGCAAMAWPYYKALRPRSKDEIKGMEAWRSPRILLDAFAEGLYGGSGKQLDPSILEAARTSGHELWLAGGISPANVAGLIQAWRPELIDMASGVEASPGKKDPAKLAELAREIDRVCI